MERIFTNALKKQLRRRINGDLSVHVIHDTLVVDIYHSDCCAWHYTINNLAVQMTIGLSSKIVSDVIVKQYRKYILNQYFR